jgi:hypothetical protein
VSGFTYLRKLFLDEQNLKFILVTEQCRVSYEDKVDCGFAGITEDQCEERNCCFDPTNKPLGCFSKADGEFLTFRTKK